jgi:hypothetical protein
LPSGADGVLCWRISVLLDTVETDTHQGFAMRSQFVLRFGFTMIFAVAVASPAGAQIADLGRIIAKKDKDAADAVDKAGKSTGAKKTAAKRRPAAVAKPIPVTAEFSPDTEDPMSVLDITPLALTHFAAGVGEETRQRNESGNRLTAAKYDELAAGAAQMTPRQYEVLKQRVVPFCQAVAKGADRPADTRLPYMPLEAEAIRPRCKSLLAPLESIAAQPVSPSPRATTKKR